MNSSGVILFNSEFHGFTTERQLHESILSENEYMSYNAYLLTAITLFFIGFFGFFLNLLVIFLMCKDVQVSNNKL